MAAVSSPLKKLSKWIFVIHYADYGGCHNHISLQTLTSSDIYLYIFYSRKRNAHHFIAVQQSVK
jgi:hypothetical protein